MQEHRAGKVGLLTVVGFGNVASCITIRRCSLQSEIPVSSSHITGRHSLFAYKASKHTVVSQYGTRH